MKYSTSAIIKAVLAAVVALIGAASAAADGPDLSNLGLDQWVTALGTALVAGAALLHQPGKKGATANDTAVATVTDVVTKAAEAHGQLVQQAVDSIQKVQEATGELTKLLPAPARQIENQIVTGAEQVLGPLAAQVIGLAPRL